MLTHRIHIKSVLQCSQGVGPDLETTEYHLQTHAMVTGKLTDSVGALHKRSPNATQTRGSCTLQRVPIISE